VYESRLCIPRRGPRTPGSHLTLYEENLKREMPIGSPNLLTALTSVRVVWTDSAAHILAKVKRARDAEGITHNAFCDPNLLTEVGKRVEISDN
jgi:hypothetical protein